MCYFFILLKDVFIESEIVAQGSLNGVFTGATTAAFVPTSQFLKQRKDFVLRLFWITTEQKGEIMGLVKEMNGNLSKKHINAYVENVTIHQIEEK